MSCLIRCAVLVAALAACGPKDAAWQLAGEDPGAAWMSVGGTASDDVWMVGARDAEGGQLLRWDGQAWSRLDVGQAYDLWWVHPFSRTEAVVGGAGGSVLMVDGDVVHRMRPPGIAADTVFGVWGTGRTHMYAVGGRAGRAGFLWHYDGRSWHVPELPLDLPRSRDGELPSLFKVWGRSASDVWAVGGHGTILHYDGDAWRVIPSGTRAPLFTVHGDDDRVVIVGGDAAGVVLEGGPEGFVDVTPADAPLLQGVVVDGQGRAWVSGQNGAIFRQDRRRWTSVDPGLGLFPQSLHAMWADEDGGVWAVGGGVLSAALDRGVALRASDDEVEPWIAPDPPAPPEASCPAGAIDTHPDASMARRWIEQNLASIRRDIPRPTVHARNLFHVSLALWDAWSVYDDVADPYLTDERLTADDVAEARELAMAYAAYRVLTHRYKGARGGEVSTACYDAFMGALGLDPADERVTGTDPVAVGNRIGFGIVSHFADDGANEQNNYADTTGWASPNAPLAVDYPGANCDDPDAFQLLNLAEAETQNGLVVDAGVQGIIGAHWGEVTPFALQRPAADAIYHDGGELPLMRSSLLAEQVVQVIRRTAELDHSDGVMMDASPAGWGNHSLGLDDGAGYDLNPVTGEPYVPVMVGRGDFNRVLAEFWADGPDSETPPGHWNTIANRVSDQLDPDGLRLFGEGDPRDRLAWDVHLYLALNGAVHDAAITAWELKRTYSSARPITLIRHMAQMGQSTDPALPRYHAEGLPLMPGLIELITEDSVAPGERHFHLRWFVGDIAVRSWRGEPGDRTSETGGIDWIRAVDWMPYQRRTFVTPAFPGFTSGHSTFSRAGAEVLTELTGSPYFPGGLGEFVAEANAYLHFEVGPQQTVRLQWARYYDAADQAGQSRLFGGIHIFADDTWGRTTGSQVGLDAVAEAQRWFEGTAR